MEPAANTQRAPSAAAEQLRRLGKYELIAMIGEGGMAEVYLARQRGPMNFEKIVVVKTIHAHLARKERFIKMLLDEARIAALLKHPSIVDIYDLGYEDNTHFIAMEHLAGEPLLAVLRAGVKQKALDVPSTAHIIADVADGLHEAHELTDPRGKHLELVHRDITPGNIIVLYSGQVKIVDFGIAKARGRLADETAADHFKGKLGYIAPEQVQGNPIDRRADIFSLGVVMWEALALRRLFRKDNPVAAAEAILRKNIPPPSKFRSSVPPKLDSICMKALARDPDERYATAEELHHDIERFLAVGSFRPHKATIRKYMQEVFGDRIKEREELLTRVAEAESSIQLVLPVPVPGAAGPSSQEYDLPMGGFTGPQPRFDRSQLLDGRTPSVQGLPHSRTASPTLAVRSMTATPLAAPSQKKLWLAIGAGVFLLVLVALAASGDDDAPATAATNSSGASTGDEVATLAAAPVPVPSPETPGGTIEPPNPAATIDAGSPDQPVDAGVQAADAAPAPASSGSGTGESSAGGAPDKVKKPVRKKPRGNPKTLYDQGIKFFVKGKLSTAKSKFRSALAADKKYAPAHRGLGMVYQRQGNKKRAISSFRKYLKLAPKARDRKSIQKKLKALGG